MQKVLIVCLILIIQTSTHDVLIPESIDLPTLSLDETSFIEQPEIFKKDLHLPNSEVEDLPPVGGDCAVLTAENGEEYYDCSFDCLFEANYPTTQFDWQCTTIADRSCGLNENFDQFNFFHVLFCSFNGNVYVYVLVSIIIIWLIMKFISAAVEEFVCPGITYLAEAMKMSPSLAAVTLVALANGAGDVITALVAGSSAGGVSYNIGSLYGSGFFVCSIVISMTIFSLGKEKLIVDKMTIYKDIGFYILATVVTIAFGAMGKIYWWSAAIFLAIYVALVVATVITAPKQSHAEEKKPQQEVQENQTGDDGDLKPTKKKLSSKFLQSTLVKGLLQQKDGILNKAIQETMHSKKQRKEFLKKATAQKALVEKKAKSPVKVEENKHEDCDLDEAKVPFSQMGIIDKIFYIIDFPFMIARLITMPPSDKDDYNKWWCIIWPVPGFIFLAQGFGMLSWDFLYIAMPIAVILTIALYFNQRNLEAGKVPSYFFIVCCIGTIGGLVWTFILSTMLIDLLNTYLVIAKLDNTYMGLTVIGIGNALPDALTTVALAQHPESVQMGITGSYSGQLFGLLVGFGLAQLKTTLLLGPQDFLLFADPMTNLLDIIIIAISLFNLIITCVMAIRSNFEFTKTLAYLLGALYAIMFAAVTGIQIWYIMAGIA